MSKELRRRMAAEDRETKRALAAGLQPLDAAVRGMVLGLILTHRG